MNITAPSSYWSCGNTAVRASGKSTAQAVESGRTQPSQGQETASISPEGRIRGLIDSFMGGAGADGRITFDELCSWRDQNLDRTQQILRETMSNLGIRSNGRTKIDIDPWGEIVVTGSMSESDRQRLREALGHNREFRSAYGAASSAATILKAGEAASAFHEAYEDDPIAAVARFRWLFDKEWDFSLFFDGNRVSYTVE